MEGKEMAIMSNLNDDMVFSIFTRIPGDFLQKKFKFQCRNWYNLISNLVFAETHLHRSQHGILLQTVVTQERKSNSTTTKKNIEEDVKLLFMDLKDMEANRVREIESFPLHFVVHGLCNGLILLKDSCAEKLYVTNPITKETISLPSYDSKRYWSRDYWNLVYVPSTKTYKVVELLYDCKLKSTVFHIQTVCASLSDSWRPIKELNRAITHYQSISINGILYIHIGNFREPIVSFDVGNETTIKLFPVSAEHRYKHQKFIDMDGLPTMVCSRHSDFVEFDVWILKDVEWVKHLTFCIPEGLKAYPKYTNVLGSLNNGEVILIEDGNEGRRVLIYYVTTKQWKVVDTAATTKTSSKYKIFRGSHVNSVISLKGFT